MEYPPSLDSSRTIWLGGWLLVWGGSGGGTWTASAIRESGCVIMKMISNTRSTSIIGVTLMSDCTPADPPVVIAMSLLLLVLVVREQGRLVGLSDGSHHANPCPAGGLDRFLHPGVLQLVVGLEVQDLVLGPGGEDRAELVFQRAVGNRALIQEIPACLIDAKDHFVLALGP